MDILAIGASAGGIEALIALLKALPRNLPATVLVVVHRAPGKASLLPQILARATGHRVVVAQDGEELRNGTRYIGMPDRHLMMGNDHRLYLFPDGIYRGRNIDALFSSLAHHAGKRTIGVILSGLLKDGTDGLREIKQAGGIALVQNPEETMFSDMPKNAIIYDGPVDFVGSVQNLADEICRRTSHTPGETGRTMRMSGSPLHTRSIL